MFPGQLPRPVKGSELAKGSCPIRYQRFAAHPSGPNVSLPDWTFARLPRYRGLWPHRRAIDGGPLFSPARTCPAGIFHFISDLVKCGSGSPPAYRIPRAWMFMAPIRSSLDRYPQWSQIYSWILCFRFYLRILPHFGQRCEV